MDFSALDLAHKQAGHRSLQKQAGTEELIYKGLRCLVKGEKKPRDKALLQEAGDCFMAAIPHAYDNPVPFVGMAYLLWLYNDTQKALYFVREALSIEPNNADAQRLLREIAGKRVALKPPAPEQAGQAVKLEQLKQPMASGQSSAALRQQQQERFKPQPLPQAPKPNHPRLSAQESSVRQPSAPGNAEASAVKPQQNNPPAQSEQARLPQAFKPAPLARPAALAVKPPAPAAPVTASPSPVPARPAESESESSAQPVTQQPVISADDLMEDLQALSQDLIGSELMSQSPSLRPHFIAKLESFYAKSQGLFEDLKADYQTINSADQARLQSLLQRCESLLKLVHSRWQDCQTLANLEKSMQSEYEMVCSQIKEAKTLSSEEDWAILQENLEGFLDLCDQLADQLEVFEAKSYPLKSLMSSYNSLVDKVTEFQQVLEGDD